MKTRALGERPYGFDLCQGVGVFIERPFFYTSVITTSTGMSWDSTSRRGNIWKS